MTAPSATRGQIAAEPSRPIEHQSDFPQIGQGFRSRNTRPLAAGHRSAPSLWVAASKSLRLGHPSLIQRLRSLVRIRTARPILTTSGARPLEINFQKVRDETPVSLDASGIRRSDSITGMFAPLQRPSQRTTRSPFVEGSSLQNSVRCNETECVSSVQETTCIVTTCSVSFQTWRVS